MTSSIVEGQRLREYRGELLTPEQFEAIQQSKQDWLSRYAERKHAAYSSNPGDVRDLEFCKREVIAEQKLRCKNHRKIAAARAQGIFLVIIPAPAKN